MIKTIKGLIVAAVISAFSFATYAHFWLGMASNSKTGECDPMSV